MELMFDALALEIEHNYEFQQEARKVGRGVFLVVCPLEHFAQRQQKFTYVPYEILRNSEITSDDINQRVQHYDVEKCFALLLCFQTSKEGIRYQRGVLQLRFIEFSNTNSLKVPRVKILSPKDYGHERKCCNCNQAFSKLVLCARCNAIKYCSKKCQKENWSKHKHCCDIMKNAKISIKKETKKLNLTSVIKIDPGTKMMELVKISILHEIDGERLPRSQYTSFAELFHVSPEQVVANQIEADGIQYRIWAKKEIKEHSFKLFNTCYGTAYIVKYDMEGKPRNIRDMVFSKSIQWGEPFTDMACHMCGSTENIKICRCKRVHYCGKTCQKRDWNKHKMCCKI